MGIVLDALVAVLSMHLKYLPIAMHSAVFCIVCSFVIFVVNVSGDYMVDAYSF